MACAACKFDTNTLARQSVRVVVPGTHLTGANSDGRQENIVNSSIGMYCIICIP